ncbi:PstS family phosphate ABC transporter substrate-binding protein [Natronoarchaeum rubrum]|uniref:PstS family phosphate ABC transporter substrate-binding protein n=1 Tax=Natronoarchaeum rubrum TaxID=755311 RepID=UPI0021133BEA|nr:PstS family phosphate ABC transporter substrate-binding protein [Natronoarchaeum rubrum]
MASNRPDSQRSIVSRRKFLGAAGGAAALSVAGCLGGGGSGLSGEVVVTGSSTVYPVSQAMTEEFKSENPGVDPSVDPTGTGAGFENSFCTGSSDINGASRPITDSELQSCRDNGVEPVEFQVASDALTVAVNTENDWAECVTEDELRQIWKPDPAQTWSDVRSEWPDEEFERYGPATTSGTFDYFTEHIIGEARSHTDDYQSSENDNTLIQGVQGAPYTIGYFGYAYYDQNRDSLKALSIDAGDGCVEPSLDNAQSGDYPLARPLYIYVNREELRNSDVVQQFVEYYLTQSSSDIVSEIGYVPAGDELQQQNLDKLEAIVSGDDEGSGNQSSGNTSSGNESA